MIKKREFIYIDRKIVSATGGMEGTPFDCSEFNRLIIHAVVDQPTGISPSISLLYLDLPFLQGHWARHIAIIPTTSVSRSETIVIDPCPNLCTIMWSVGGTVPSWRVNVRIIGIREL